MLGPTPFTFTMSLSRACDSPVTVNYATADGSARAGTDNAAASGTVTFAPGQTSQTVTVLVNGDRLVEPKETFFVNLSGANSYAVIGGSAAVGAISDSSPRIWIGDAYNSGESTLTFLVSLSSPYDQPVTVNFATADGTAIAGVDYVATSGTLTFAPGETELVITVEALRFPIVDAEVMDFTVQLSGPSANASITSAIGTGYFYRDFGGDGGYGDWDSGCGCYW